jgi:hypothetical protein
MICWRDISITNKDLSIPSHKFNNSHAFHGAAAGAPGVSGWLLVLLVLLVLRVLTAGSLLDRQFCSRVGLESLLGDRDAACNRPSVGSLRQAGFGTLDLTQPVAQA